MMLATLRVLLVLCAVLPSRAAVDRIEFTRSAPGTVDGASIHFQNVTHNSVVVRWGAPDAGNWQWPIEGYRLRLRSFVQAYGAFDLTSDPLQKGYIDLRNVSLGGASCNCQQFCFVEDSSQAPCTGTNADGWVSLGHVESTYPTCHAACCDAGYCGDMSHFRRRAQAQDAPCQDCGCAEYLNRPASDYLEWTTDVSRIVASNGVPASSGSEGVVGNPRICQVRWNFTLPLAAQLTSVPTPLPQSGVIGVAIDGVPFYSARLSNGSNAVAGGASCAGQPGLHGDWHYQQDFRCSNNSAASGEQVLLGYALDGFPLYGPLLGSKANVDSLLDRCNGRMVNGSYRYHARTREQVNENASFATVDGVSSNWNYLLGCFSGTPSTARINLVEHSTVPLTAPYTWGYITSLDEDAASPLENSANDMANARRTKLHARTPDMYEHWSLVGGPSVKPGSSNPDTHYPLFTLQPDTLYYVQVQAYNMAAEGAWSTNSYALHMHTVPDRPQPVVADEITVSALSLRRETPRTRGTVNCESMASRNISGGICTTWGAGSPVIEYMVSISIAVSAGGAGGAGGVGGAGGANSGSAEDFNPPVLAGCTDRDALNFDPDANQDNGNCIQVVVGCSDSTAFNYNPLANVASAAHACVSKVYGCTSSNATNFNVTANIDDGSCYTALPGCTNPIATNWNPYANLDDGSCITQNVWIGGQSGRRRSLQDSSNVGAAIATCSNVALGTNVSANAVACTSAGGGNVCTHTEPAEQTAAACVATAATACASVNATSSSAAAECAAAGGGSGSCEFSAASNSSAASCTASAAFNCSAAGSGQADCAASGACTYVPLQSAVAESCVATVVDFQIEIVSKSTQHPAYGSGSSLAYSVNGGQGTMLNLTRGRTYVFALNWTDDSHPFYFTESAVGGGGTILQQGVNGSLGTGGDVVIFTPGYGLPNTIYYQCYLHQYMGGSISLHLDQVNYPQPLAYPECVALCWTESPLNNQSIQMTGIGNYSRAEPYTYGAPDWYSYGSVCNWLASVMWGCNVGNATHLAFTDSLNCSHTCMRNCAEDILNFSITTLHDCPFGCDGDAATGPNVHDMCGVCGGNGHSCSGCMDTRATNYDPAALRDSGDCLFVSGCTDSSASNYNPAATTSTLCEYPIIVRCNGFMNPFTQCENYGFSSNIIIEEISGVECTAWHMQLPTAAAVATCSNVALGTNVSANAVACTSAGGGNVCTHTEPAEQTAAACVATAATACASVDATSSSAAAECAAAGGGSGSCEFSAASGSSAANCTASAAFNCSAAGSGQADCAASGACTYVPLQSAVAESCVAITSTMCTQWSVTTWLSVNTSGCPDYAYNQSQSCLPAMMYQHSFAYPLNPTFDPNAVTTQIPADQPIGVAINGIPIFRGDVQLMTVRNINGSNVSVAEDFDNCRGQIDDANQYHYRQIPLCIVQKLEGTTLPIELWDNPKVCQCGNDTSSDCGEDDPDSVEDPNSWPQRLSQPSSLIGWALDGFPIYGPYDELGNLTYPASSGGQLDECNGRVGLDGRYRYHMTPLAPYTVGCLRGTVGTATRQLLNETCAAAGWVSVYDNSAGFPSCNVECMPTCVQYCVDQWALYQPSQEPYSGLLSNSWLGVPPAPRVYHVPAAELQYIIRNLDPCTRYSVKLSDVNAVGKSSLSEETIVTTRCRPKQPSPVMPLEVTSSSITLQWDHAVTEERAPIVAYRLFAAQREWRVAANGARIPYWVPVAGSNNGGDWDGPNRMFKREIEGVALTRAPNASWDLMSDRWIELNIPSQGNQNAVNQNAVPWTPAAAQKFTVNYLEPNRGHKFRITAINGAGESFASYDSMVITTLDAEITHVQIYSGMPCVPEDGSKVPFHAVSDGTNVQYAWRTSWGGSLGQCKTEECAAMTHSFGATGDFQAVLYASNSRGFMGQIASLDVRMCGCPDPVNSNYWFASEHVVPRLCDGFSWDNVDKSLGVGASKYFSFPLVERTFAAKIILRVEVGEIDVFISNAQVPHHRMNTTFQASKRGITSFALLNVDYNFLFDDIMRDFSKRLYITVVGTSQFARFDIFTMRRDFTKGPDGPAERRNLDSKYTDMMVGSGYYDFWEFYFPKPVGENLVDVTIDLTITYGCITMYVSKYERYPSPLRAYGSTYGHDASKSRHACAGQSSQELRTTVSFTKDDPNTLFVSAWGGKVYQSGTRPPMNGYNIEGSYSVIYSTSTSSVIAAGESGGVQPITPSSCSNGTIGGTEAACELTGNTYTPAVAPEAGNNGTASLCSNGASGGSWAACVLTGFAFTPAVWPDGYEPEETNSTYSGSASSSSSVLSSSEASVFDAAGVTGQVHYMGWYFVEVTCSTMALSVSVVVQTNSGQITLYERSASRPSRGKYDHRVHDDDGNGVLNFTVGFNEIGPTGSFHIGLFGEAGGVIGDAISGAVTNGFTITAEEEVFQCNGEYYGCTHVSALEADVPQMDTALAASYVYYVANLETFANADSWDNTTGIAFGTQLPRNLFEWAAPLSMAYITQHFDMRIINTYLNVTLLPISGAVSPEDPVTCVLYGSTDDPFPGHKRTYDTWLEYVFDTPLKPGTADQPNYASLMLPSFSFSGTSARFSVTCDAQLTYKVTVEFEQFDHGAKLAGDFELRYRLCPGQRAANFPPCNGHGTCIDEGFFDEELSTSGAEVWSTPAAICHCDNGWVGTDCNIERYPAVPYMRIVRPLHGQTMNPQACAPCINATSALMWSSGTSNESSMSEEVLNLTNRQFYQQMSPYRQIYEYDELILQRDQCLEGVGCGLRVACPPCGKKGVQILYELRTPDPDCTVVAYVDGVPHASTVEGDKGIISGNTTHRMTVVNLLSGPADQLLPHTVQLFLTYGDSQIPIGNAFAEFFVSEDANSCPNGCSGHGICHHGYCVCFDGWNGEACDWAGEPSEWGFEPFSTYSNRISTQLEQEMAAEAANSDFAADRSVQRLQNVDTWLKETERDARARIDSAAAHNRKEMQVFLAAQKAVKEAQAAQVDIETTDWSAAFAAMDSASQQLLNLASARTQILQSAYEEVERRLTEDAAAKELKAAQLHSVWMTTKEKSAFNLRRLKTMNGPRVPIEQLEVQQCTSDRLHNVECENMDASANFQEGSGYVSNVYRDPYDAIVVEEQSVDGLYHDVPR